MKHLFLISLFVSLSQLFAQQANPRIVPPGSPGQPKANSRSITPDLAQTKPNSRPASPDQALEKLMQGNQRYTQDKLQQPRRDVMRREATLATQHPFATILSCSDSRVPPEIVFDQGIGDLFIVRVAGNVVGPLELDSIEYASIHLGSSLVFVMGHENCGAIEAVMNGNTEEIESIAQLIAPSITLARSQKGDLLENGIKQNVRTVVDYLRRTPALSKLIAAGKVKVVGGYYNLETGHVSFVDTDSKKTK